MMSAAMLLPGQEGGSVAMDPEIGAAARDGSAGPAPAGLQEAGERHLEELPEDCT